MKWQRVLAAIAVSLPVCAAAQHDSDIETLCRSRNEAGETAIIETRLAAVPALMRIPSKVTEPPILLWHGFGPPASERALMEALPLDEVPAVKIYLGLPVRVGTAVIVNASTGLTASVQAYERATKRQYVWSDYTRNLAHRTDAIERAADIARDHPALLIVHGTDDAMLPAQNAIALREALAPFYRESNERLRLELVDGLSHGWADSAHGDELRREIGKWFKVSG